MWQYCETGIMRLMRKLTRRQMRVSLPAFALAPRITAVRTFAAVAAGAAAAPPIRPRTLNHFGIAVADPKRSIDFYQGLFGLPIVARQESTTILRVGAGPQFLAIAAVASGAAPSITHYCLGVESFNVDRLLATLAQHGVTNGGAVARPRPRRGPRASTTAA